MIQEFNKIVPDTGRAAFIAPNAVIIGDVVLEEGSSIWYGAVLRGDTGRIHIGRNSNIQDNCVIHCDAGGRTEMGENVTVGHGAIVHGCSIGDGSMIGMGSIVMSNAVIGDHCLVGAGSLITEGKTFASHSLILGNPARAVRQLTPGHLQIMEHAAREYISLSRINQDGQDPS